LATDSRSVKSAADDALAPDAPYEQVVERLEKVVSNLERSDLPLEESVLAFREGMDLLKRAEEKLRASEKKVEELLENGKTIPLIPDRSSGEPVKPASPRKSVPPAEDDIPF